MKAEKPPIDLVVDNKAVGDMEITIESCTFYIRPYVGADVMVAFSHGMELGFQAGTKEGLGAANYYILLNRIRAWKGPKTEAGDPAPCSLAAKEEFFAKNPWVLIELTARVQEEERRAEGNLESLADGLPTTTQRSAEIA